MWSNNLNLVIWIISQFKLSDHLSLKVNQFIALLFINDFTWFAYDLSVKKMIALKTKLEKNTLESLLRGELAKIDHVIAVVLFSKLQINYNSFTVHLLISTDVNGLFFVILIPIRYLFLLCAFYRFSRISEYIFASTLQMSSSINP